MQSDHACACFGEVALFQEIYENVRKSTKKGAILGLGFGPEIDKKCSKLVPGASGVQNRGEGSDLGCKMEGKGSPWGAKWREKERFGSTVAEPALAHWIRRARRSLPLGVSDSWTSQFL